ncbi:MAG: heat shock protein Hsp20 [Micavibrio sp.]|nr:heat shock protein Hsp20 [Micavibrio sp.]
MPLTNLVPFNRRTTAIDNTALAGWDDFQRDMDRLFDSFFGVMPGQIRNTTVAPSLSLDVSETEKAYHISADMPGLEQKDVEISLTDNVLTIRAERRQEEKQEGQEKKVTWHRSERSYGSVRRALQLPADADDNSIEAAMKNGVLQIEIAKRADSKPASKKIEIKSA